MIDWLLVFKQDVTGMNQLLCVAVQVWAKQQEEQLL